MMPATFTGLRDTAKLFNGFFGSEIDELARQAGFLKRRSLITPVILSQTLIFGWMQNPTASLTQLCGMSPDGVAFTVQALHQRLTSVEAVEFGRKVLEYAAKRAIGSLASDQCLTRNFPGGCYCTDATTVTLPGHIGNLYPEFNTTSTAENATLSASMKLSVTYSLSSGAVSLSVNRGTTADSRCREATELPPPDSLTYNDLGYYSLKTFQLIGENGAYWVTRHNCSTAVFVVGDGKHDNQWYHNLSDYLEKQTADMFEVKVLLGVDAQIPARMVALRLDEEATERQRKKAHENAVDHGRAGASEEVLKQCKWVILQTNAPPQKLTTVQVLQLGRIRWQIELLFRAWKELGMIDEWRTANPNRILCEIYFKMAAALMLQWIVAAGMWQVIERSVVRCTKLIRQKAMVILSAVNKSLETLENALLDVFKKMQVLGRQDPCRSKPATHHFLNRNWRPGLPRKKSGKPKAVAQAA